MYNSGWEHAIAIGSFFA